MGYIFMFISAAFNTTNGFCSKKVSISVKNFKDALDIAFYRNILCCVFSFIVLIIIEDNIFSVSPFEIIICTISGISTAIFILSWIFAIQTDSYMLVSTCASSSFIVPAILGVFFLNEKLTVNKIFAFLIILIALFFLLKYNKKLKGRISANTLPLLASVLISQGVNQAMQKIYTYSFPQKDVSSFTFYSAIFTVLAIIIVSPLARHGDSSKKSVVLLDIKVFLYSSLMAVALFGYSYFQTLSAKTVDAIILYPVSSALTLIGAATISSVFFGEKMNRDSIIGVILVFIALLLAK